ncbi:MAG: hypothetical protein ACI83O_000732 [Patescibacteria group bacterium]|jgi:hypothetical protein
MIDRNAHERSGLSNLLINVGVATATGVTALLYSAYDPKPLEGTFGQNVPRVEESITDYQSKPGVPVAPYEAVDKEKVDDADLVITYDEWKNNDRLEEQYKAIVKDEENSKRAYELLDKNTKDVYDITVKGLNALNDNDFYRKVNTGITPEFCRKYDIKYSDLTRKNITNGVLLVSLQDSMHKFDKSMEKLGRDLKEF